MKERHLQLWCVDVRSTALWTEELCYEVDLRGTEALPKVPLVDMLISRGREIDCSQVVRALSPHLPRSWRMREPLKSVLRCSLSENARERERERSRTHIHDAYVRREFNFSYISWRCSLPSRVFLLVASHYGITFHHAPGTGGSGTVHRAERTGLLGWMSSKDTLEGIANRNAYSKAKLMRSVTVQMSFLWRKSFTLFWV